MVIAADGQVNVEIRIVRLVCDDPEQVPVRATSIREAVAYVKHSHLFGF